MHSYIYTYLHANLLPARFALLLHIYNVIVSKRIFYNNGDHPKRIRLMYVIVKERNIIFFSGKYTVKNTI